jgi:hypothetical protein
MDQLNSAVRNFDGSMKKMLSFVDNEYVSAALTIFLIVYASYAAPKLPPSILRFFDNPLFQLLIFFLIAYMSKKNPTVSIVAAIALMATIYSLNKFKLDQMMKNLIYKDKEHMTSIANRQLLIDPAGELVMEEVVNPDMHLYEEAVNGIQDEVKGQPLNEQSESCNKKDAYRNHFYPQYVNMKPDAYMSRYTGNEVGGFDPNAAYSSV